MHHLNKIFWTILSLKNSKIALFESNWCLFPKWIPYNWLKLYKNIKCVCKFNSLAWVNVYVAAGSQRKYYFTKIPFQTIFKLFYEVIPYKCEILY